MYLVLLISPNCGQGRGSKNPENLRDILYGWSLKPTTSYSPLDSLAVERKPAILSDEGTWNFPISDIVCSVRMEARNVEELEEEMDVDK